MKTATVIVGALLLAAGVGAYLLLDHRAPPAGMVWVPGGWFWMGSDEFEDAKPVHQCYVDGFWMDATEVTNEQFAKFVTATGYRTVAERVPQASQFPDVPKEDLR